MNIQNTKSLFSSVLISWMVLALWAVLSSCHHKDDTFYIDEWFDRIPATQADELSFIHISDTHGSTVTIEKMIPILNASDCQFALISGDIMTTPSMLTLLKKSTKPVFLTPGNHDAYQWQGQKGFRMEAINSLHYDDIHFANDTTNYYYADIRHNGKTLRIINLEQYEVDVMEYHWDEGLLYSQQQIDWFCNVLKQSEEVDGIIIQIHCGFGNKKAGTRDVNHHDTFISKLAYLYDNSYDYHWNTEPTMIPEIVNAYTTGKNIVNKKYPTGIKDSSLIVNTQFTTPHNNFIAYCGGHLHWDLIEHLPYFTDHPQLQMLVAFSGNGRGNPKYDDLAKTASGDQSFVINYNTINFAKRTLRIERLGASQLVDGTRRDSITFAF